MGAKDGFIGIYGKGGDDDAIGPINGAIALSLDDSLLGRPCDDMGAEVIGADELLFTGIQELIANPYHLPAVTMLGIQPNGIHIVERQGHQPRGVGDAYAHPLVPLDDGGTLLVMNQ